MNKQHALNLLNNIRQRKNSLVGREILSYASNNRDVIVRVAGLVMRLRLMGLPEGFEEVALVRLVSDTQAEFVRQAEIDERERYLDLFTPVRVIMLAYDGSAIQFDTSHSIHLVGMVKINTSGVVFDPLDVLKCRFDGTSLIMDSTLTGINPMIGDYLRQQLDQHTPTGQLRFSGLTARHRDAYDMLLSALELNQQAVAREMAQQEILSDERRLSNALAFQRGELISYAARKNAFKVEYTVDGEYFTSIVRKDNLQVLAAGVCLDDTDRSFDLTSIVGVLRKGINSNSIVHLDNARRRWERGSYDDDD